ncbi:MAG: hypothetical protein COA73_13525 [Candidatus Hydrogenedentota bacterium]|nr:MAG: hypothetical protein COA73_13525 [Candidatus Hydrogenedentota bacterium]
MDSPTHIEKLKAEILKQKGRLVKIHQYTKQLLLISEELGPECKNDFQVIKEHRDAHEHSIRFLNEELKEQSTEESLRYILSNVKAAVGHEKRAFYDTADLIGIIIREDIQHGLGKYDRETIQRVLPKYHEEFRPQLNKYGIQVAELRAEKDIEEFKDDLAGKDEFDHYYEKARDLLERWIQIDKDSAAAFEQLENLSKAKEMFADSTASLSGKYSRDTILLVFPDYYSEIRPKLEDLVNKGDIKELQIELNVLSQKFPSLEDAHTTGKRDTAQSRQHTWLVGIVAVLIGSGATYFIPKLLSAPESVETESVEVGIVDSETSENFHESEITGN